VTESPTLDRRRFLRHAAVVTGLGLSGFGASGFVRAAASTTTTLAWTLDSSWGFPKGAHGRTSCGCHACLAHAANKVFATEADADAGRAHAGCLCEPASFALRTTIYDALFSTPGVTEVDRRDPYVADLLGPGTQTQVEAFAPARARVGDVVILTGRHFSGAVNVTFHGLPARFTVDSDHQISLIVPPGAGAGLIVIEMPDATATTPGIVEVRHRRTISVRLGNRSTYGRVWVPDGFEACRDDVGVKIQRLERSVWVDVIGTRTTADGRYRTRPMTVPGRYRAVAKWKRLPAGDVCMRARSDEASHRP
jgi:IPT/TIG domain